MTTQYTATQLIIRISHVSEAVLQECAKEIAHNTAARLGVDGANITFGSGLWKGEFEPSAAIEIVTVGSVTNSDMNLIRAHVTALGLTAFCTVNIVTAHELF